jgi:hypothetical protein
MNAVNSIPALEMSHYLNLVTPFTGSVGKRPRTEGKRRVLAVFPWTSKDYFGVADPSTPQNLGNHSMRQAVNLVESAGPDELTVAVSATKISSEEAQDSPEKNIQSFIFNRSDSVKVRARLLTAEDRWGQQRNSYRRVAPSPGSRFKVPLTELQIKKAIPKLGKSVRLLDARGLHHGDDGRSG